MNMKRIHFLVDMDAADWRRASTTGDDDARLGVPFCDGPPST